MANEAARARAGATFMDAMCVGWPEKIDADTLDLQSCDDCVFGQSFDDHYINVCMRFGLDNRQAAALGFTSDVTSEETSTAHESTEAYAAHLDRVSAEYAALRSAWLVERDIRLEEARVEAQPQAMYASPL